MPAPALPVKLEDEDLLSESTEKKKAKLPLKTQVILLGKLIPFMLPLFLVYFGEYLINQGISPVLRFPDSPFDCKEYLYYQLWYACTFIPALS